MMLYPADLSSKFSSFSSIGCHITVQKTCRLIQRESWLCRTCIWTLSLAVQTVSVLTLFYLFIYLFFNFVLLPLQDMVKIDSTRACISHYCRPNTVSFPNNPWKDKSTSLFTQNNLLFLIGSMPQANSS